MTVTIETEVEASFPFDHEKLAREVVAAALAHEGFPYEAEVGLFLVSPEAIRAMNREYRQIDHPTDVLSFPMAAYGSPGDFEALEMDGDNFNPDTGEAMLGDIVLNVEQVEEQARQYGHSEEREYAFLILHSMLHLFGYDHETEEEAAQMEKKQKDILDGMGIAR
ncbi:MAG: rRNA maturation RNase YbeY [Lachnospiraceae bacterium]|nr:rRNA maturation RNase YbeY [Lachnospiraceae bacterium]